MTNLIRFTEERNIEFSHLTPEDLEFFTTILYDQNGNLKSEGEINEFIEFLPTVSTIIQAIKNGDISTAAFINWTKGQGFRDFFSAVFT